jgi:hypothetical protein
MTLEDTPVLIGFALVGVWLTALTASQVLASRRMGEPVFRRLPGGRIRFEWQVGTAYHAARRAAGPQQEGAEKLRP